jgi:hypothetical protein
MKIPRVLLALAFAAPALYAEEPSDASAPAPTSVTVDGEQFVEFPSNEPSSASSPAEEAVEKPKAAKAPRTEPTSEFVETTEAPSPSGAEPRAAEEEGLALREGAPAPGDSFLYTVKKGDTLWDISGQYLQDPFRWPRVFEANRGKINDPDLIFPEQEFVLPGGVGDGSRRASAQPSSAPGASAAATEEPAGEERASSAAAGPEGSVPPSPAAESPSSGETAVRSASSKTPTVSASRNAIKIPRRGALTGLGDDSFVAAQDWAGDGYIMRDQDRKILIAQDDVVYLSLGAAMGVQPKMFGSIFRKGGPIRDPQSRQTLGYQVRRVGTLQVSNLVGEESATAVVVNSLEPIRLGDIVYIESLAR